MKHPWVSQKESYYSCELQRLDKAETCMSCRARNTLCLTDGRGSFPSASLGVASRFLSHESIANQRLVTSVALQLNHAGQAALVPPPVYQITNPLVQYTPPSKSTVAGLNDGASSLQSSAWPAVQDSREPDLDLVVERISESRKAVDQPIGREEKSPAELAEQRQVKSDSTKVGIGYLSTFVSYLSLSKVYRTVHSEAVRYHKAPPRGTQCLKSWLVGKACHWLNIYQGNDAGLIEEKLRYQPSQNDGNTVFTDGLSQDWEPPWTGRKSQPENWRLDKRVLRKIPDYVMEYAPLVHLFSGEQFWPCDIAEHLYHITPFLNYTPLQSEKRHPTLENLDKLNEWQRGRWIFLTSNDNVEERPEWLEGEKNIPTDPSNPDDQFEDNAGWIHHPGKTRLGSAQESMIDLKDWFAPGIQDVEQDFDFQESLKANHWLPKEKGSFRRKYLDQLKNQAEDLKPENRIRGGRSDAPAVLVTVDKGHGVVDAFWFFFYSFNLGNVVFNVRFGNHVGDWEHTAIRFHDGKPKAIFFSEHNFGSAYSYDAVEKIGKRPVIYSAVGTHAMYATPGLHPYVLPWGILHDQTDRGPLWDPALNSHTYTYDYKNDTLRSSDLTPDAPTEWFHFAGHWGDKFYPMSDRRQYRFVGQYHYVNGPLGPKFKNLQRKKICAGPDSASCVIKNWLGGEDSIGLADGLTANPEDGIER